VLVVLTPRELALRALHASRGDDGVVGPIRALDQHGDDLWAVGAVERLE
jgi:hypothetical protein